MNLFITSCDCDGGCGGRERSPCVPGIGYPANICSAERFEDTADIDGGMEGAVVKDDG